MNYMAKEIQDELKRDIQDGKIWGLKLVSTSVDVLKRDQYALIFGEPREIVGFDNECFYLRTRYSESHYLPGSYDGKNYVVADYSIPTQTYFNAEAYYKAFNYYDGNILRSTTEIKNAVNPKDIIQITEYQVIRSY